MGEADLPAQQPQASEEPRVPPPDVDPCRPCRDQGPTAEGPPSAVGLTWRIRDRATFTRLRVAGRRTRNGPVTVTFVDDEMAKVPRVAYSVGRRVGNAVVRNRLKRRLRAIVAVAAPHLPPG